jgi:hypothetical protein
MYELTEDEFVEHVAAREPIVEEWRRDAVVVVGQPLTRLIDGGVV